MLAGLRVSACKREWRMGVKDYVHLKNQQQHVLQPDISRKRHMTSHNTTGPTDLTQVTQATKRQIHHLIWSLSVIETKSQRQYNAGDI